LNALSGGFLGLGDDFVTRFGRGRVPGFAVCQGGGALITPRDVHHGMTGSPAQFDRPLPLGLVLS
jgi:hypothetical protein